MTASTADSTGSTGEGDSMGALRGLLTGVCFCMSAIGGGLGVVGAGTGITASRTGVGTTTEPVVGVGDWIGEEDPAVVGGGLLIALTLGTGGVRVIGVELATGCGVPTEDFGEVAARVGLVMLVLLVIKSAKKSSLLLLLDTVSFLAGVALPTGAVSSFGFDDELD